MIEKVKGSFRTFIFGKLRKDNKILRVADLNRVITEINEEIVNKIEELEARIEELEA